MGITGHKGLSARLLPTPSAFQREVARFSVTELLPLGRRVLSRHIRQRMDVKRGTFDKATRTRLLGSGQVPMLRWLIDHPGADIQDRGGTIKAKSGGRMTFKIPGVGWRSAEAVTLTAQNYLTPALRDIQRQSVPRIERHFAGWLEATR